MILRANLDKLPLPQFISRSAGILVSFIGGLTLIGLSADVPVLRRLFPYSADMNSMTAAVFIFSGIALFLGSKKAILQRSFSWNLSGVLAVMVGSTGFLTFIAYMYKLESFQKGGSYIPIAINSSVGLMAMAVGVLALIPKWSPISILTSNLVGGRIARGLLLAAIIPFILGWLQIHGAKAGLYSTEFGTALFAVSHILFFSILILWWAHSANCYDALLKNLNSELEKKIAERAQDINLYNKKLQSELEERKRSDESLRQSERKLREAQKVARVGSWEFDLTENRVTWSDELFSMLQIDPKLFDATFEGFTKLVHPDDRPALATAQQGLMHTLKPFNLDLRMQKADGEWIYLESHGSAIQDSQGRIMRLVGTALDITERYNADLALKKTQEQVQHLQKMDAIGALAGGIAHDFNNILSIISLYIEELIDQAKINPSLSPSMEAVLQIKSAGDRAASLTRQLLLFSRQQPLYIGLLDLNIVLRDFEKMLKRLIGENIELKCQFAPDLGYIQGDRGQIEQIILNLIVNARDAMPQGGNLRVETMNASIDKTFSHKSLEISPGRYVVLAVTDTGMGMNAATQERIFDPFFTTKEIGKGTGLGLSTVYGIVKQHNGGIFVYSEIGKGTVFRIYFPETERKGITLTEITGERSQIRGTEIILLIEDETALREVMTSSLKKAGYQVLTASNGDEGLELAKKHSEPISLLISDVILPGLSGPEIAAKLKELKPDLKVLFISGYIGETFRSVSGSLKEGFLMIEKPLNLSNLLRKIREILDAG